MAFNEYDGSVSAATATPVRDYYGTAGNDQFWLGFGEAATGAAGNDTYYFQGGRTVTETAGGGIDKIVAWSNVDLADYAHVENVKVENDGLYAAGNALANVVEGGGGAQQLFGGMGADTLIGGAGADTFIVYAGYGSDVIVDFAVTEDVVRLKMGVSNFSQLQLTQSGADTIINLGGDTLTLSNVQASNLTAANFALQIDYAALGAPTFAEEFSQPFSMWDAVHNPTGVWSMAYDYNGVDGYGSYTLPGNAEKQIYTSPYFRQHNGDFAESPFRTNADGTMTITARASTNPEIFGYGYTSGLITTRHKDLNGWGDDGTGFSQKYGYFEMRADVPEVTGTWPAFWLVPASMQWPPELDVMEILGDDPNVVWTTAHSAATGSHTASGRANYVPDTADGFHTYGTMWSATDLIWFVDGVEVFRTATPGDMHEEMSLLANMALGGWAGETLGQLPAEMHIDYIRAYALPGTPPVITPPPVIVTPPPVVVTPPPVTTPPVVETPTTPTVTTDAANYVLADGVVSATLTGAHQTVTGNGLNNVITSNNNINTLIGGGGDDTLVSGRDSDTLTGGDGADTFAYPELPWNGTRITDFTAGQDVIDITGALAKLGYSGSSAITDGWVKLDANGANAQLWIDPDGAGSAYGFWLVSTLDNVPAASLQLSGGVISGVTIIAPPPPPVTTSVTTDAANYLLADGVVTATLTGARQTVTGNGLNNVITSNNNINTLIGGGGDDTLVSGRDSDTLTGGEGADTFVYPELPWNGTRITDFTAGQDTIDVSGALAKLGYTGSNPLADGWMKIDANGANAQIWIDPDGAGSAYSHWLVSTLDNVAAASLQLSNGIVSGSIAPPVVPPVVEVTPPPVVVPPVEVTVPTADLPQEAVQIPETPTTAPAEIAPPVPVVETVAPADILSLQESGATTKTISGTIKAQILRGTTGADKFDGKGGGDTLTGGAGNDTYVVYSRDKVVELAGGGIDTVQTKLATYTLAANVENVTLTGSAAQVITGNGLNNLMTSNGSASTLKGGAGDDVLVAGRGGAVLTGGAGSDVFQFDQLPTKAARITDFAVGSDVVDLRGLLDNYQGIDPIADGWVKMQADVKLGCKILVDLDGAGAAHGFVHVVSLTGVNPLSLEAQTDWAFI